MASAGSDGEGTEAFSGMDDVYREKQGMCNEILGT